MSLNSKLHHLSSEQLSYIWLWKGKQISQVVMIEHLVIKEQLEIYTTNKGNQSNWATKENLIWTLQGGKIQHKAFFFPLLQISMNWSCSVRVLKMKATFHQIYFSICLLVCDGKSNRLLSLMWMLMPFVYFQVGKQSSSQLHTVNWSQWSHERRVHKLQIVHVLLDQQGKIEEMWTEVFFLKVDRSWQWREMKWQSLQGKKHVQP